MKFEDGSECDWIDEFKPEGELCKKCSMYTKCCEIVKQG